MATPTKGVAGMPTPGGKRAPHFDSASSNPRRLLEFFQDFEDLAKDCGLTDDEKTRYNPANWNSFKDNILDMYPGGKKGERKEADIVAYYQEFRPAAVFLEAEGEISVNERNRLFWEGLHPKAQKAVRKRLEITEGKAFSTSKVPDMEKVVMAAREVYADDAFDAVIRKSKKKKKRYDSSSEEEESESE
ncbi:hypothetical protein H0H81_006973, partial [Sphagnurus paluster]